MTHSHVMHLLTKCPPSQWFASILGACWPNMECHMFTTDGDAARRWALLSNDRDVISIALIESADQNAIW